MTLKFGNLIFSWHFRVYLNLIKSRANRPLEQNFYYEEHHVFPKCIFKKLANRKYNKIKLTAREHFIAHHLLFKTFENLGIKSYTLKMAAAWFRMCKNKQGLTVSSRMYEEAKKMFGKAKQKMNIGKHWWTNGTKTKISIKKPPGNGWCLGRTIKK